MIRKITAGDFDFIYSLYMHPGSNPYLLYEWMDTAAFQPIYQDLLRKEVIYIYCHHGNDTGMFKLIPLTYRSSHIAYLGGLAIHSSFSGMGYGFKMMQEIIAFANGRGFLRIELSVAVTNKRAIHLYTKAGFEKEGLLKKYTHLERENKFVDELMMACLL